MVEEEATERRLAIDGPAAVLLPMARAPRIRIERERERERENEGSSVCLSFELVVLFFLRSERERVECAFLFLEEA